MFFVADYFAGVVLAGFFIADFFIAFLTESAFMAESFWAGVIAVFLAVFLAGFLWVVSAATAAGADAVIATGAGVAATLDFEVGCCALKVPAARTDAAISEIRRLFTVKLQISCIGYAIHIVRRVAQAA
ncbi:MAG: hypothetical protein ABJB66_18465 [Gemmatimonadaceae bacterium]